VLVDLHPVRLVQDIDVGARIPGVEEELHQPTLTPQEITQNITNRQDISYGELDETLWQTIQRHRQQGYLVLCMGAGTIDGWIRQHLEKEVARGAEAR
jgi:UDP-N-acetylmuramate-alanine ligase